MTKPTCSVDGCNNPYFGRGLCNMHYKRHRKHGDLERGAPALRSGLDQIMAKVVVMPGPLPTACWVCSLGVSPSGYNTVTLSRPTRRTLRAYKFMYELFIGPVPTGLELDHLCRVRNCVNPFHLEAVTHSVNILRGYRARSG